MQALVLYEPEDGYSNYFQVKDKSGKPINHHDPIFLK